MSRKVLRRSQHCHQKNPQKRAIVHCFNATVGVNHNSWPVCLGQFGTGKMNENGQHLLVFCCHHSLCISNTFFNTKPQRSLLETPPIQALVSERQKATKGTEGPLPVRRDACPTGRGEDKSERPASVFPYTQ